MSGEKKMTEIVQLERNEERLQPWKRFFSETESGQDNDGQDDEVRVGLTDEDSPCYSCGKDPCECASATFK